MRYLSAFLLLIVVVQAQARKVGNCTITAAAVQRDSLDVGAGQAALLKKIEELTLYTIEQKKQIEDLQVRMERMEKLLTDKNDNIHSK